MHKTTHKKRNYLTICSACSQIPIIEILYHKDYQVKIKCICSERVVDIDIYLKEILRSSRQFHYCKRHLDDKKHLSNQFCYECREFLCKQCLTIHPKNHTYLSTNCEMDEICPLHLEKNILYCFDCSQILCVSCPGHLEHSYIFLPLLKELINISSFIKDLLICKRKLEEYITWLINQNKKLSNDDSFNQLCTKNKKLLQLLVLLTNTSNIFLNANQYSNKINLLSNFNSSLNNVLSHYNSPYDYNEIRNKLSIKKESSFIIHMVKGKDISFRHEKNHCFNSFLFLSNNLLVTTTSEGKSITIYSIRHNCQNFKIKKAHSVNGISLNLLQEKLFHFPEIV